MGDEVEESTPAQELAQVRKELAELKAENEKLKNARQPWLDRHFPVVVTALLSLATLTFSAVQWRVAQLNEKTARAERARVEAEEERRRDEEWNFKGLEFIFSHEQYFFGDNPREYQQAVRILAVGFPERVSAPLLKRLALTATPAQKHELKKVEAQLKGEPPPPRPANLPPEPAPRRPKPVVSSGGDPPVWREERPRPLENRVPVERPPIERPFRADERRPRRGR